MKNFENIFLFNERLIEGLNNILKTPLTLISAQIGAGKTTAVRFFLNQAHTVSLWYDYRIEEEEKFWNTFCERIRAIDKEIGQNICNLCTDIPETEASRKKLIHILSNMAKKEKFCFVLDNFTHGDGKIIDLIYYIAKQYINNFHIIVISRETFHVNCELLLTRNFFYIQNNFFLLNEKEIELYYKNMNLQLTNKEIIALYRYSEGWFPILLNVAENILHNKKQFLIQNINLPQIENAVLLYAYSKFSDCIKNFLNCLSFAECFSLSYAQKSWEFICEQDGIKAEGEFSAQEILSNLCHKNLFITYYADKKYYRIQHIYQKILQKEFLSLPQSRQNIYYKSWIKTESQNLSFWHYDRPYKIEGFINALENFNLKSDTFRELLFISYFFLIKNYNTEWKLSMKMCEKYICLNNRISQQDRIDYYFLQNQLGKNGNYESILTYLHKQVINLKKGTKIKLPFDFIYGFPMLERWYFYPNGKIEKFLTYLEDITKKYNCKEINIIKELFLILKGSLHLIYFELDKAEIYIYAAEQLICKDHKNGLYLAWIWLKARLYFLKGNIETAKSLIQNAKQEFYSNGRLAFSELLEACGEWLSIYLKEEQEPSKIEESEYNLQGTIHIKQMVIYSYMISKKMYPAIIGKFYISDSENYNFFTKIYLLLYQSIAYKMLNQNENAQNYLKQAINLAFASNIYLPFVLLLEQLIELVEQQKNCADKQHQFFINQMLEYSTLYNRNMGRMHLKNRIKNSDFLTKREKEIAIFVHDGMSNKEIAKHLLISENTVKSVLKLIFKKLNIHSRRDL